MWRVLMGRVSLAGSVAILATLIVSSVAAQERSGGPPASAPSFVGAPEGQSLRPKVNINVATVEDLERLPGIDNQLSQRIIANRPYRKIDDLIRRRVLGRKQLAGIKEYITVGKGGGPQPQEDEGSHSSR